jgi:hypothetical protein
MISSALWRVQGSIINPLTAELNPSAQRCLTKFFTGDFASSVHFVFLKAFIALTVHTNKQRMYNRSLHQLRTVVCARVTSWL